MEHILKEIQVYFFKGFVLGSVGKKITAGLRVSWNSDFVRLRYTLEVIISQNGVSRPSLVFDETGGAQKSPADSADPDIIATVLTVTP